MTIDVRTNLILMAIAVVLAASRVAFSQVKKRDRQSGLYIADRYYTLLGTFMLLFMSEEKRTEKEKEKPFEELAKEGRLKKQVLAESGIYALLMAATCLLLYLAYGMNTAILADAAMIVIALSYLLSKSRILCVFILVFSIITGFTSVIYEAPLQLLASAAGTVFFIYDTILRKRTRPKKPDSKEDLS